MDCNKDEASRAKALAENMMRKGHFARAQKLVMKAQSLFSGLDSLPQMLAVCDVHCSADNKINDLENWYGILQVMHFSDDATIKKQYKKLALLLHPDKNQFPGAEAAFKLIGEANRFLADKEKRTQYDIKRRIYSRVSSQQCADANNAGDVNKAIFWTCCEHCGCKHRYLRQYVNTNMFCSSCQRSFMAYNTGFNGVPPKSSTGQKEVRNQGACNTFVNKNVDSSGAQTGNVAAEMDKKGTFKEKFNKKSTAEPPKADGLKVQPEVTKSETDASKSVPDESVSRCDQAPSTSMDKKRKRKVVDDHSESTYVDSKDNNRRTSHRKSRQASCADKGSSDSISPPTKRSRSSVGSKSERTRKNQNWGVGSKIRLGSGGSSASSRVYNGKVKKNVDSGYQEISATKDKKSQGSDARGEGMGMAGKIDNNHKANDKPITQDSPDPDFNNFEPTKSCFAVNQVWSLYDLTDGMPRLYARIEKVLASEFKLWITWIDPLQDNKENSIPIACGIFQDGESQEVDDPLIFSCQMRHIPRDKNIVIYPRKGEIWAVFRGWDISWSDSSENHKRTYEYDFVEVLSDFNDVIGLGVAYLGKVEGFVSLFRRDAKCEVLQLQIPPSEMLRFSHKVPSFKMTGKEREGVPPGCFELDTAALPKDMFEFDNSKVDAGLDRGRRNGKTGGLFSEASKVEVHAKTTLESSLSPKKCHKIHENHSSSSKAADGMSTNHVLNSVKKSRKSVKAVDDLKLRKSPRRLSETNNQATSRSGQEKAEKKNGNDGESCGQPDGFCLSDEKMATPKKPEKIIATDSRIRKTPRELHKPTGNSKKRGRNDESLSQSRGKGLPTRLNGAIKSSEPETHGPSSCTTRQVNTFNFENQRSADKFRIDQIWAIYSNDKGMPRKYGQIKRIDTSPELKLHVAPLELCRPPNLMTHPVCCGRFKLKTGKAEVLVPSSFSHQVKALKSNINRFDVYPGKGEIWALYRNLNAETEEFEIVEVVETDEQSIQVALLTAKAFNKLFYGRSQELKVGFVDIPKMEVSRFSHQIPAFRHEGSATRSGDGECWELDSKAVFDLITKNP
ncbi:hypothetical protein EUTSA_v10003562mg [Eutrema salsugineum]|uniref:J domain-containing protein n=1 Tax=Eutrema salsugineum TaxID=72664 RepID=V4KM05_EUTSA|nr:uncharacterized protein LOC18012827 [Eutrema salsugineum]ESQ32269.1 hypothetical protein EUTSA_v10003562mg [Eutrema salsugineum]